MLLIAYARPDDRSALLREVKPHRRAVKKRALDPSPVHHLFTLRYDRVILYSVLRWLINRSGWRTYSLICVMRSRLPPQSALNATIFNIATSFLFSESSCRDSTSLVAIFESGNSAVP